jgi:hypothetical protein
VRADSFDETKRRAQERENLNDYQCTGDGSEAWAMGAGDQKGNGANEESRPSDAG